MNSCLRSCSVGPRSQICPEQRRRIESPKWLGLLIIVFLLGVSGSVAQAQKAVKIPRIGFISPSYSTAAPNLEAFRHGLRDLGYVDGENIIIETRWAEGSAERISHFIAELIQSKIEVMLVGGAAGALAARNAKITTPVVFAAVTDPIGYGIIDSLARPGGNITGTALAVGGGFSGKWVELLKEVVPKVTTMAVLRNPNHPLADVFLRETQSAGQALGVKLDSFEARDGSELGAALSRMEKERIEAVVLTPDPFFTSQRTRLVEFVARRNLPSMFFSRDFADAGGLMSYGPSFPDSYRRAAVYVDRILKGARPADLPVEQPTKFELVINLKTAKQIGLTIPPNLLARADRVIR